MKRAFLVVLGLLIAASAHAVGLVIYVSPNGTGNQDGSSCANSRAWNMVTDRWGADDRMQLCPGTYNANMLIQVGGSPGGRVMIVGDLANPSNVVFTGNLSVSNRHYISVRGIKFNGNISYDVSLNDTLTDVIALGSATFNGFQNGVVRRFTFGTANSGTRFGVSYSGTSDVCERISGTISQNSKFEDGTVYAGVLGSQQSNAWITSNSHEVAFRRIRFHFFMAAGVDQTHPVIWYRMKNCVLEDSWLGLLSQTTMSGTGNYIWSMRDSSIFNRIERDTFVVDTTGAGTGKFEFAISGTGFPVGSQCPVGSQWNGSGSCRHNTYRDNLIDIDGGFGMFNVTTGDSVVGNAFYTDHGLEFLWGDSLTFAHNTIYSRDDRVLWTETGQLSNNINMHHNVFVGTGTGPHVWTQSDRLPTPILFDRNLYYSTLGTDSSTVTDNGRVGPGTARCTGPGFDCNSRWLPPQFTKPSRPNPDLRPVSGAFALQTGLWGGDYVGAYSAAPSGDVTAPGAATDVTLTGSTSQTIDVQFTSPGDDGSTGTPNRYDVRYATAGAIDTPAEWDAAAVFASPPTPVAGGGVVTFTITGLSPATTFFVAIRAVDEANNIGGFGNSPSRATSPLPDGTPPSAITTLAVIGAPTSSSVLLQWQAPGDDNSIGFATSYQGRYSTSPITTAQEWAAASQVSNMPTPQVAGTTQSKLVSGLNASTRYYFNVRAVDEANNIGGLSNNATTVTAAPPDLTLPGTIADLSASALGSGRINLTWSQAGDDGFAGVASSCEVRRAATAINSEGTWASATSLVVIGSGTISSGGEQQTYADDTVSPSTTYFYAVRAVDDAGNVGDVSNSPSATTPAAGDVTRPDEISTLAATNLGNGAVRLQWTSTGNDSITGTATSYDVRYRQAGTFVEADWAAATQATGEPVPLVAGSTQSMTISGLAQGVQYAFAMKVSDSVPYASAISNAAVLTTTAAPPQLPVVAVRRKKMSKVIF